MDFANVRLVISMGTLIQQLTAGQQDATVQLINKGKNYINLSINLLNKKFALFLIVSVVLLIPIVRSVMLVYIMTKDPILVLAYVPLICSRVLTENAILKIV
jgi:hypothetical protein